MTNGNSAPDEATLNAYANTARQAAEQSLKSLDMAVNWALTMTLAVLAFTLNLSVVMADSLKVHQRLELLMIIALCACILNHFSIRAAKSYLNVVRFSKLEREAVRLNLEIKPFSPTRFKKVVATYHLEWRSPLKGKTILRKILFELGFFYLALFLGILYIYVAKEVLSVEASKVICITAAIPLMCLAELVSFVRSPYMKDGIPNHDVERKA